MFVLQVKTDEGWKDVQTIWDDEAGLCYAPSPENPARFAEFAVAQRAADDVAEEYGVAGGVFDDGLGIRVYIVSPART